MVLVDAHCAVHLECGRKIFFPARIAGKILGRRRREAAAKDAPPTTWDLFFSHFGVQSLSASGDQPIGRRQFLWIFRCGRTVPSRGGDRFPAQRSQVSHLRSRIGQTEMRNISAAYLPVLHHCLGICGDRRYRRMSCWRAPDLSLRLRSIPPRQEG